MKTSDQLHQLFTRLNRDPDTEFRSFSDLEYYTSCILQVYTSDFATASQLAIEIYEIDLAAQLPYLRALGYEVEDLFQEYGEEFLGTWRWTHKSGEFQDTEPSYSEDEAWKSCYIHYFTSVYKKS